MGQRDVAGLDVAGVEAGFDLEDRVLARREPLGTVAMEGIERKGNTRSDGAVGVEVDQGDRRAWIRKAEVDMSTMPRPGEVELDGGRRSVAGRGDDERSVGTLEYGECGAEKRLVGARDGERDALARGSRGVGERLDLELQVLRQQVQAVLVEDLAVREVTDPRAAKRRLGDIKRACGDDASGAVLALDDETRRAEIEAVIEREGLALPGVGVVG